MSKDDTFLEVEGGGAARRLARSSRSTCGMVRRSTTSWRGGVSAQKCWRGPDAMDLLVEMMRGACSRERVEHLANCKRESAALALRAFDEMRAAWVERNVVKERTGVGGTFPTSRWLGSALACHTSKSGKFVVVFFRR